jgi:hypothetical protein
MATTSSKMRLPMTIGVLAAIVWAHYLPNIWPLPPRNDMPPNLQWSLWWEIAFKTALGLAAAGLAMRAVRFWEIAILLTSGFVVVSNIPMVADVLKASSVELWFSQFRGLRGEWLYYLFVVPLYHVALVAVVIAHTALRYVRTHRNRENAA